MFHVLLISTFQLNTPTSCAMSLLCTVVYPEFFSLLFIPDYLLSNVTDCFRLCSIILTLYLMYLIHMWEDTGYSPGGISLCVDLLASLKLDTCNFPFHFCQPLKYVTEYSLRPASRMWYGVDRQLGAHVSQLPQRAVYTLLC